MTRARIGEGLELLVLRLAMSNPTTPDEWSPAGDLTTPPDGWTPHEWAYVKGLASACVLFWRGRLLDVGEVAEP